MTNWQIETIIRLIQVRAAIAAHPQTPGKHLYEEAEMLEERLRDSEIEEDGD